jgi:serine/threonine protein kinase
MNDSVLDFINQPTMTKSPSGPTLDDFFQSKATSPRPVSKDFKVKLNESIRCDGSTSELSHSVNDSARGLKFEDVYDKKEVLGEGGFAIVYRCIHKDRRYSYAVKVVHNENYETSGESIYEEIDALKKLRDGPYIVRLLDVFRGPTETYLVMEQMKGGDLLARLGEKEVFSESESRRISRKLIEAVFFCHKKRIAHRDIKLENILLTDHRDDTKIKLADFGCAHPFIPGKKSLKSLCGSPQYAAPELYLHENGYDERCDIWSTGVVIFVLLGGYAPFEGSSTELPGIICEGYFNFPSIYWNEISQNATAFIKSLLVVDPDDRATLVDALDSEWLRRRDKESFLEWSSSKLDQSTVFDAWVRLQKEPSKSKLKPPGPSHSELSYDHTDSSESISAIEDSTGSIFLEDL